MSEVLVAAGEASRRVIRTRQRASLFRTQYRLEADKGVRVRPPSRSTLLPLLAIVGPLDEDLDVDGFGWSSMPEHARQPDHSGASFH